MRFNTSIIFVVLLSLIAGPAFAESTILKLSEKNIPPIFEASYQLEKGSLQVGILDVALEKPSNQQWLYHSSTRATGVATIFLGKKPITDHSQLMLFNESIVPISFEHIQKKGKKDRSQYVSFNWQQKTAQAKYKEKDNIIPLEENMFDNFSVQLLLMANIHNLPNEFTLPVISKAKRKPYNFYKIGLEKLSTSLGVIETMLIERRKDNEKNSTYRIWAAVDAHGLPLQIEKIENGKQEYIAKIISANLLEQQP